MCNSLFPGYTDLSTLFLYFRRFVVVGVFDNGILLPYGPSSLFFGALVLLVLSRPTEVASPVLVPVPSAVLALIQPSFLVIRQPCCFLGEQVGKSFIELLLVHQAVDISFRYVD